MYLSLIAQRQRPLFRELKHSQIQDFEQRRSAWKNASAPIQPAITLYEYYAKRMGLPVDRLICVGNRNNVLSDFFTDGIYYTQLPR